MRTLQQHLSREMTNITMEKPYLNELLRSLSAIMQSQHSGNFVKGLYKHSCLSSPLFRLLLQMKDRSECAHFFSLTLQVTKLILLTNASKDSSLYPLLLAFESSRKDSSSSTSHRLSNPVCISDVSSEQRVLDKLNGCPVSELERVIRDMGELAMREGKIALVVKAIVHLLISKLKVQSYSSLPGQHIALLLDWLQVLDPELHFIPLQLTKTLLFGNIGDSNDSKGVVPSSSEVSREKVSSKGGYSQAYLLAAFTHQATWETLENTIHELLRKVVPELDPSSVLDFVWAVLHVPKLWQGRERRSPRHIRTKMPLNFNQLELVNLMEYILSECKNHLGKGETTALIQKRIKLLFNCSTDSSFEMRVIVKHLNSASKQQKDGQDAVVCSHLLYQMYLHRPCIIKHLSKDSIGALMKVQEMTSNQGQSAADVSLHTLLTMLTSPLPGKDFFKRMQELEATVRKIASLHPLLVIRHLSLLAATLQGLTHLHWSVFKGRTTRNCFRW
ncbi:UNVERIFIED_CONTAM: hypothetical protein GTU68_040454 [Idotea baltica]|nr:hypothetical protein [Idotea baltica]